MHCLDMEEHDCLGNILPLPFSFCKERSQGKRSEKTWHSVRERNKLGHSGSLSCLLKGQDKGPFPWTCRIETAWHDAWIFPDAGSKFSPLFVKHSCHVQDRNSVGRRGVEIFRQLPQKKGRGPRQGLAGKRCLTFPLRHGSCPRDHPLLFRVHTTLDHFQDGSAGASMPKGLYS